MPLFISNVIFSNYNKHIAVDFWTTISQNREICLKNKYHIGENFFFWILVTIYIWQYGGWGGGVKNVMCANSFLDV